MLLLCQALHKNADCVLPKLARSGPLLGVGLEAEADQQPQPVHHVTACSTWKVYLHAGVAAEAGQQPQSRGVLAERRRLHELLQRHRNARQRILP